METIPEFTSAKKKRADVSSIGNFSIVAHGLYAGVITAGAAPKSVGSVMLDVEVLIGADTVSPEIFLEFMGPERKSTTAFFRSFNEAAIDALTTPSNHQTILKIGEVRYQISTHQMFERAFRAAPNLRQKTPSVCAADAPRTITFDLGALSCIRFERGWSTGKSISVGVSCEISVGKIDPLTSLPPIRLTLDIGCDGSRILKFDLTKDEILAFGAPVLESSEPGATAYNSIAIDVGREILQIPALPVYSFLRLVDPSIFVEIERQVGEAAKEDLPQLMGYTPPPKIWDHLDCLEAEYRKNELADGPSGI